MHTVYQNDARAFFFLGGGVEVLQGPPNIVLQINRFQDSPPSIVSIPFLLAITPATPT